MTLSIDFVLSFMSFFVFSFYHKIAIAIHFSIRCKIISLRIQKRLSYELYH